MDGEASVSADGTNSLVAERQDTTSTLSGAGLLDDIEQLSSAINLTHADAPTARADGAAPPKASMASDAPAPKTSVDAPTPKGDLPEGPHPHSGDPAHNYGVEFSSRNGARIDE